MNSNPRGFTLIELLITLAIVAVLAAMAMPIYSHYLNKAKFVELIEATGPVKTALDVCMQTHSADELTMDEDDPCLNAAEPFILETSDTSDNSQTEIDTLEVEPLDQSAQSSSNIGYSIIVTAKSDLGSDAADGSLTYQLDGSFNSDDGSLRWTTSGSCQQNGWC